MTIRIHFCNTKTDIQTTFEYNNSLYKDIKEEAANLAIDISGHLYGRKCYEGCLAETLIKFHLNRQNIEYTHPGYITHGRQTYDRGDLVIDGFVLDVKTSSDYVNVSFSERTDVKIDYIIGTHIRYNESNVDLYVYGYMPYKDSRANDIKGKAEYVVIPPKSFTNMYNN